MEESTLDWYNRNAKVYYHVGSIYPEDAKSLKRFIDSVPNDGKVLDAGCGSGNFTQSMAKSGLNPIGIDLSQKLIEMCKNANKDIDFRVADMRDLPFSDNYFNGIWAHASLVHMVKKMDVAKCLNEFSRVLKDSGRLHITVKKKKKNQTEKAIEPKTGEKRFFRYFGKEEICQMIESAGFSVDTVDDYNEFERNGNVGRKDTNWINIFAHKI